MMFRSLTILIALCATAALWFAYQELSVFRRTVFWDYRYVIFGLGAFLALSLLEFLLGWLKSKTTQDSEDH